MSQELLTKFDNKEKILATAEKYFTDCFEKNEPLTVTGLAMKLGITRGELVDFPKDHEYYRTVSRILLICENYAEKKIYSKDNKGAMFILKNLGWKDRDSDSSSLVPVGTQNFALIINKIYGGNEK